METSQPAIGEHNWFTVPAGRIRPVAVPPAGGQPLSPRLTTILDELEAIFMTEGFARLTIGDLAARCRCSRRTLYELASGKDELVLVVVDRLLRNTAGQAATVAGAATSYTEAIQTFARAALVGLRAAGPQFHRDAADTPLIARHIDQYMDFGVTLLESTIERGMEAGEFRSMNPRIVAEVMRATFERVHDPEVLARIGASFDEAVAELEGLFTAALTHR